MRKNNILKITLLLLLLGIVCGLRVSEAETRRDRASGLEKESYDKPVGEKLELRIDSLMEKYKLLLEKVKTLQNDKENLLKEEKRSSAILAGEERKIEDLSKELSGVKKRLSEAEELLKEKEANIRKKIEKILDSKYKKKISGLKKRLQVTEGRIKNFEEELKTQDEQIKTSGKKLREVGSAFKDKGKKLQSTEKELQESENRIKNFEEELKKQDAIRKTLSAQIKIFKADKKKLAAEVKYAKHAQKAAERKEESTRKRLGKIERKVNKEKLDMHYNLAVVFDKTRMYEDAEREYLRCLKMNPEDAGVHYNLGILYDDKLNENTKAIVHYKKFLKLRPMGDDSAQVKQWILNVEQEKRIGVDMR